MENGLNEQDQIELYKLSILLQPLIGKKLAIYLGIREKNIRLAKQFAKRLIESRIFDERFEWFRHDLVQKCFEDKLDCEESKSYHSRYIAKSNPYIVMVRERSRRYLFCINAYF